MILRRLSVLALLLMPLPLPAAAEGPSVHAAAASPDSASLRFEWPQPVAAAVFAEAGAIWIAFDRPAALDLREIEALPADVMKTAEQLPAADAAVLRLTARAGLAPVVRRSANAWIIELRPDPTPVVAAAVRVESSPAGPRLVVAARGAAAPIDLPDPAGGEHLVIIPLAAPGIGNPAPRHYADFAFLPSAQGLVLRPKAQDLRLRRTADGIEISRPGGLTLSPAAEQRAAVAAGAALLDFAVWRGDEAIPLRERRRALEQAIAAAPESQRFVPRLALARFYFANLYAAEAEGVLAAIRRDTARAADDPTLTLMQGAAALLNGDPIAAARALTLPVLDREPEALMWRAALAAETGQWALAAEGLRAGAVFLPAYPKALRNRLALDAAEALIETGHADEAQPMIGLVLGDAPSRSARGRALYLDGRRALAQHDLDRALALFDQAIALNDAPSRARAVFARTMALLDAERITRRQAIDTLDGLRFAWRGDRLELLVLRALGELRLADGDGEGGFAALRSAAVDFPDDPLAAEVARELGEKLSARLAGDPQDVAPLQAVALYEEYKDFLPVDAAGDRATEHLIDRLAALDLPGRAAVLLEQHLHRLAGAARERAVLELARLRLLDQDPAAALRALDLAGERELTPEERHRRQELRAQTLAALDHRAEASAALTGDARPEAERLRLDLAWQSRDWRGAADALARLLATLPRDRALSDEARRWVIDRAAALVLAGDQQGLAQLGERYGAALAGTALADAFRVLTVEDADPGSEAGAFRAALHEMRAAAAQGASAP